MERKFGALGFRGCCVVSQYRLYHALDFDYDMSIPNVAHLDPQRGGCCTVFPFFNGKMIELPAVTMAQDYSIFHILNDYSIDLWKQQIALIREKHRPHADDRPPRLHSRNSGARVFMPTCSPTSPNFAIGEKPGSPCPPR